MTTTPRTDEAILRAEARRAAREARWQLWEELTRLMVERTSLFAKRAGSMEKESEVSDVR